MSASRYKQNQQQEGVSIDLLKEMYGVPYKKIEGFIREAVR